MSTQKRGFTTAEKWIIWGVFCLLIGLSSHITAFFGLMIASVGVVGARRAWRSRAVPALLAAGLLTAAGIVVTFFGYRWF
jgi:hypothetical protein